MKTLVSAKKICPNPDCKSGNTYVLVGGAIICRTCGYDGRIEMKTQLWKKSRKNTLGDIGITGFKGRVSQDGEVVGPDGITGLRNHPQPHALSRRPPCEECHYQERIDTAERKARAATLAENKRVLDLLKDYIDGDCYFTEDEIMEFIQANKLGDNDRK